jgi:hypothetical protein
MEIYRPASILSGNVILRSSDIFSGFLIFLRKYLVEDMPVNHGIIL